MASSSIELVDFEPVEPKKRPSLGVLSDLEPALRQEIRQKGIDVVVAEFSLWESRLHRDGKRLRHSLKQISQEHLEVRLREKLACYNSMGSIWGRSIQLGLTTISTYGAIKGANAIKNVFELAAQTCKQVSDHVDGLNKSTQEATDHRYQLIGSLKQDHQKGMETDERSWQESHQVVDRVHQTQQRVFELLLSSTSG